MELCLHQVRGRAAPLSVTLRQCTREEAETVYRLQNEVRAMMPNPELFMPDTLENIQSYLEHDLCLGVWDGERLWAYFILRSCPPYISRRETISKPLALALFRL